MIDPVAGSMAPAVDPGSFPADLSPQRLVDVVARLADLTGRRIGTPGGQAAAAWLAGHLADLGATVTLDTVPDVIVREVYATPTLQWSDGATTRDLVHRRDFAEHLASADLPTAARAPAVPVDAVNLSSSWVLAPAYTAALAAQAASAGAIGLLVPRGVDGDGWMPKMIAGPPPAPIAVVSVRTDLHRLMTGATGVVAVTAAVPLRTTHVNGTNVYAVFAEPIGDAMSILLTAHFDGVGDDPDVRLPAACDNASGVAVVIEAARLLAPILPVGVGLAVALLDGEEAGARGSAHHAEQVRSGTFVINVDGAAQLGEAAAVEAGGPAHRLLAALDQAGRAAGVPLRAGPMPSDNRRYTAAGLPAIGIGMGMPGYQTPAETPDRVQTDTLIEATWLVVATVRNLTTTRPSPLS